MAENCTACGRLISDSETACVHEDRILCGTCYTKGRRAELIKQSLKNAKALIQKWTRANSQVQRKSQVQLNTRSRICIACGTIDPSPPRALKGSCFGEVVFWFFVPAVCLALSLFIFWFLLLLIPLAFLLAISYSLSRHGTRERKCRSCGGLLVSLESPKGRELAERNNRSARGRGTSS